MKTLQTLLTIGNTYVDPRGKRPDFLHDSFCNLPLMRRSYDVELSIQTLKNQEKNREWKENFVLTLSKIESRKRILSCHSRKSRVEREFFLTTLENREQKEKWKLSNFRDRERNFSFYSRFFSRERDSCQCLPHSVTFLPKYAPGSG